MKVLNLMLLMFLLAGGVVVAQDTINTPSALGAPGVEVVKNSWRRTERNLRLEEDPLRVNEQQASLQKAQIEALNTNANLAKANTPHPPVAIPTRGSMPALTPKEPRVEYIYEVEIRNTGTKTIRKLVWEYVFSTSGKQPKLTPHLYESKTKIRPGQTRNLVVQTSFPPFGVIDVRQVCRNPQCQPPEKLVIQRVEYDDGSVWMRDSK